MDIHPITRTSIRVGWAFTSGALCILMVFLLTDHDRLDVVRLRCSMLHCAIRALTFTTWVVERPQLSTSWHKTRLTFACIDWWVKLYFGSDCFAGVIMRGTRVKAHLECGKIISAHKLGHMTLYKNPLKHCN